jgi:hypothetical protein
MTSTHSRAPPSGVSSAPPAVLLTELYDLNSHSTQRPAARCPKGLERRPFFALETTSMTPLEKFLLAHGQSLPSAALSSRQSQQPSFLPEDARQAANQGLRVFPVSPLAKMMATPDLLIGEATSEIAGLEELAAKYGPCREWRAVADPWLCVLRIDGAAGGNDSVSALSQVTQEACHTLMARRGDMAWAFFRSPKGFVQCPATRDLPPGLSVLSAGTGCPVPLLGGCARDLGAEIEIGPVPFWLRELVFDPQDNPGKAAPVPAPSPRPVPCRPTARFPQLNQAPRKGHPVCGHADWRGGYRISRRR